MEVSAPTVDVNIELLVRVRVVRRLHRVVRCAACGVYKMYRYVVIKGLVLEDEKCA